LVCWPSPMIAWPARRPATLTPIPNTRPMDSGLTRYHPCNEDLLLGTPDMMVAAPDLRGDLFESNTGVICRMAVREVRYRNQSPLPAQFARAGRRRR
jgi:hypothetical protein